MLICTFHGKTYLLVMLASLLIVLVITPVLIRLAIRIGVLDRPDLRKDHSRSVPLLGGVGIYIGMWVPLVFLNLLDNGSLKQLTEQWGSMIQIFAAGSAMLVLGLIDDKRGLSTKVKFSVQFAVAIILVASGMYFKLLSVPFYGSVSLGIFGPFLTLFWFVGVTNAFNLIDGIDGLATGVAFFVSIVSALIAIIGGSGLMALIMCALGGASLGFLKYNFHPARIFLGDAGSLFIGMTVATASVATNNKGTVAFSMLIPVVMLGYPILDSLLAMINRKLRGKPMFQADNGHIHHRLLGKGCSHEKAIVYLYGFCVLFCAVALLTMLQNKLMVGLMVSVILLVSFAGAAFLGYVDKNLVEKIKLERPMYRLAYLAIEMAKIKLEAADNIDTLIDIFRHTCECLEMDSLKLTYIDSNHRVLKEERLVLKRRRSGIYLKPIEKDPMITKQLTYLFEHAPMSVEVKYVPAESTIELQKDLPRLLMELTKVIDQRIRRLGLTARTGSRNAGKDWLSRQINEKTA